MWGPCREAQRYGTLERTHVIIVYLSVLGQIMQTVELWKGKRLLLPDISSTGFAIHSVASSMWPNYCWQLASIKPLASLQLPPPTPRIPLLSLAVIGLRPPGLGGVAVRDNCSLTFAAVCFSRLLTSCSCGCEDVCMHTWVSVWRRRPMQVESSLPLCGFWESNLGLQAWEQVPVPADPSLAPLLCSFPRTRPHLCFCFLFPRYFRVGCAHTEQ